MILLTNTTAQTLTPGQSITFDEVILHSGCGECFRRNTSSAKMRFNGIYEVHFSGNIGTSTAAGTANLAMTLSGNSVLPETNMLSVTATVGDLNNVSSTTLVKNCCGDYDRISVVNNGTTDITVGANSCLAIHRLS